MSIEEDAELRAEIARIQKPLKRNSLLPVGAFGLLMFASYIVPLYARNEFNFTSLSAFFSILGAAALWWESNHSDVDIIPDFSNLTDHRDFTIPGIGWMISYVLVAATLLCLGISFLFRPNHHAGGIIILKSILTVSALIAGAIFIYYRYNRSAYDLQALVRADVIYIKNLPPELDRIQLTEASRRIRQASKLSRNALRSTGFFFLLMGGGFVLADELHKVWPELYVKATSLAW